MRLTKEEREELIKMWKVENTLTKKLPIGLVAQYQPFGK